MILTSGASRSLIHCAPADQEANFNYLSGVIHPNASVLITFTLPPSDPSVLEPDSESETESGLNSAPEVKIKHELFIPPADPEETMWSVPPPTLDEARTKYDSDSIQYTTDLPSALARLGKSKGRVTLHTLPRIMEYPALPELVTSNQSFEIVSDHLFVALHIARLTKDEHEIAWIREANRISSGAHEVVMRELGRFARARAARDSSQDQEIPGKEESKKSAVRTGKETLAEWEIESEGDAEAVFVAACRRMG